MASSLQTTSDVIYFSCYVVCLYFSFMAKKTSIPGHVYLRVILVLGLTTEIIVLILRSLSLNENLPYYAYIPIEYCLLVLFYLENTRKSIFKKMMLLSVLPMLVISLMVTYNSNRLTEFPSSIYNTSCFLNTACVTTLFFYFEGQDGARITSLPLFWIYTALLVFYSGIFFFNLSYNYYLIEDKDIADALRVYINTGLNCIFYSLLTYGFICSERIRKGFY